MEGTGHRLHPTSTSLSRDVRFLACRTLALLIYIIAYKHKSLQIEVQTPIGMHGCSGEQFLYA